MQPFTFAFGIVIGAMLTTLTALKMWPDQIVTKPWMVDTTIQLEETIPEPEEPQAAAGIDKMTGTYQVIQVDAYGRVICTP